ncbi:MAG: fructose bisphosphate aldolase [Paracoccaceae bacterium]|nr:fructose bisphosphate aldolase [Paracoccaceae bacterium]
MRQQQTDHIAKANGFIAALDQSGGSTPKALQLYGISKTDYTTQAEMFDLIHAMRARIVQSSAFSTDHILGAILFEQTIERRIGSLLSADYLWKICNIVPFLKVDKGLSSNTDGVSMMAPIPALDALLERAIATNIFGTKMRSVIESASASGIKSIVAQQFDLAQHILSHGLTPILEPEVNIAIVEKSAAEALLLTAIQNQLDALPNNQQIMLKLTLPEAPNHYAPLIAHPRVLRVLALSGGYNRHTATQMLSKNTGMIASFSRALTEGLSAKQSKTHFDQRLAQSILEIFNASISK